MRAESRTYWRCCGSSRGIALGYRIDEIFDGKPKSARGDTWEGIGGGLANAGFLGQDLMSFGISGLAPAPFSYDIKISSRHGSNEEKLSLKGEPVFEYAANMGATLLRLASKKPGLPAPLENLPSQISNTVKLDPSPAILRGYSAPKEVRQMGGTRGKFRWR